MLSLINPIHASQFHLLKIHFDTILPSMPRSSKWFFPLGLPTKTLFAPSLSPICATCPIHLIIDLITQRYLVRSTQHEALNYGVFSTPLPLRLSCTQISSSPPYSQTSSAYVHPSAQVTKLHIHTKQEAKLQFCVPWFYVIG